MQDRYLSEGEAIIRSFRAHWRSGVLGITMAVLLGGLGVVVGMVVGGPRPFFWSGLIGLGVGVAAATVIASRSIVEWLTTRYWVTNQRIVIRTGLFTRSRREIPVDAINSVAVRQHAVERLLGYGDMAVESAGANSRQVFTNIPEPGAVKQAIYQARAARTMQLSGGSRTDAAPTDRGRYAALADLADLRDRGAITDAEFEAEKAKILPPAPPSPAAAAPATPAPPEPPGGGRSGDRPADPT